MVEKGDNFEISVPGYEIEDGMGEKFLVNGEKRLELLPDAIVVMKLVKKAVV